MTFLSELVQLSLFLFLIFPAIVVVVVVGWLDNRGGEQPARRKLMVLLVTSLVALAVLDTLLWTNPSSRNVSGSVPALGTLTALVALLALLLMNYQGISRLWATDKLLLAALGLTGLVLTIFLWLRDSTALYGVVALTFALAMAWWIVNRLKLLWLAVLCLALLGYLIFVGGGAFFTPGLDGPQWWLTALQITIGLGMLLTIFLPSALLYTSLRDGAEPDRRKVFWRIVLAVLLIGGSAYMVYWDAMWSSALSRVFEDHLPFAQFLLSVMAGTALALALSGWRRLAGLVFVLVVCTVAIQALLWGWNASALALTERRAERVNAAIERYYQANGRFPESLVELTPRYLLYLPPPVVVRLGGWCYQGGQDFYRLGYVSGQFSYEQAAFEARVFDQAGNIPAGGWNCDKMVERLMRGGLNY
jgi:hypothetical protein